MQKYQCYGTCRFSDCRKVLRVAVLHN
jgi:hypothetical protein